MQKVTVEEHPALFAACACFRAQYDSNVPGEFVVSEGYDLNFADTQLRAWTMRDFCAWLAIPAPLCNTLIDKVVQEATDNCDLALSRA